jgi:tetratricopeptide (TPR) repeat protein
LEQALTDKETSSSYRMDRLCRSIGEYYESHQQFDNAIIYWDKAVKINPKVGIARRLEAMKKTFGK